MNATRFYSAIIKLDRDLDETRLACELDIGGWA